LPSSSSSSLPSPSSSSSSSSSSGSWRSRTSAATDRSERPELGHSGCILLISNGSPRSPWQRSDNGRCTERQQTVMRIVKAGVLYFVLVFGAGFVLGTTRTTTPRSPHIGTPLCNRTCFSRRPDRSITSDVASPRELPGQPCPTVRLDERYATNAKNVNFMQSIFAFLLHL